MGDGSEEEKTSLEIDSRRMDERKRYRIKVTMLNRSDFRSLFGLEFANQCGHFLDRWMSAMIHSYADWIEYPKGDLTLPEVHRGSICAAEVSNDGCFLYTGSDDSTIIEWDLRTNLKINQWKAEEDTVYCLAYSPGLLISGGKDGLIRTWDILNGYHLVNTLKGHTKWVLSVSVNEAGTEVVSGSGDFTIRLWSLKTNECLRLFEGHSEGVYSVRCIDDSIFVSGGSDSLLIEWNRHDGTAQRRTTVDDSDAGVSDLSVSCDGSMIAAASEEAVTVYRWPKMEVIFRRNGDAMRNCRFHPCIPWLLAMDEEIELDSETEEELIINNVDLMDVRSEEQSSVMHIRKAHKHSIHGLRFTPDGTRMVTVSGEFRARIWDISHLLQK